MDREDIRNLSLGKVPPKRKKSHQIWGTKQGQSRACAMSGESLSSWMLAYTKQTSHAGQQTSINTHGGGKEFSAQI